MSEPNTGKPSEEMEMAAHFVLFPDRDEAAEGAEAAREEHAQEDGLMTLQVRLPMKTGALLDALGAHCGLSGNDMASAIFTLHAFQTGLIRFKAPEE